MEDRGSEIAAVSIAFVVASWFFVSMRIYIRGWMIKALGMDDWLMVITLVLFTLNNVSVLVGVSHGTGTHESSMTTEQRTAALKAWWFSEATYVLNTCALKIAIGAFLLRVTGKKSHRYIIYGVTVGSTAYSAYFIFLVIFQCLPVSYFWDKVQPGRCVAPAVVADSTYAHSAISAISDWTFGILPVFIVHDLNMQRSAKISIATLLCFANIGSIATLLRIQYIEQLDSASDFLFHTANIAIWSTVEPGIGIIAGSLATYRPLFRYIFSETGSLRFSTRRTALAVSPRHSGYQRTSSVRVEISPASNPSSPTLATNGAPLSKETKRWYGWNQRYKMNENLEKAKRFTQSISSETNGV